MSTLYVVGTQLVLDGWVDGQMNGWMFGQTEMVEE